MPLTSKGQEIKRAMTREYGTKKGEQVFYASRNAGRITGVDRRGKDELRKAELAGRREAEAQRQAKAMLEGKGVSGRDRAKLRRP